MTAAKPQRRGSGSIRNLSSLVIAFAAGFGVHLSSIQHASIAFSDVSLEASQPTESQNQGTSETTPKWNENEEYTWIGNHWIPPKGVPTYSVEDMREIYGRHNILWLGDSTARRAYLTLFKMIDGTRPSRDIAESKLENPRVIDLNKRGMPHETCSNATRDRDPQTNTRGMLFPQPGSQYFCRKLKTRTPKGNMDYGSMACARDALRFALAELGECDEGLMGCDSRRNVTKMSSEYTILVFGMGIWDAMNMCKDPNGAHFKFRKALGRLVQLGVPVIWRTSGFEASNRATMKAEFLNEVVRKQFDETVPANTSLSSYIDFGTSIKPRSFRNDRIQGDIPPHYGLEARLLYLQMLTHRIVMLEEEQARRSK